MGNRLSKIVTRTGDAGETGLADGSRVRKSSLRVAALGEVDELNCCIGVLLVHNLPETVRKHVASTQHELFDLGGELSLPEARVIGSTQIERLENSVARLNHELPPLKEFVLPGGNPGAASAHVARAVARRAERAVWSLGEVETINPDAARYLNRLSDLLFVCSRILARQGGGSEVLWRRT